MLLAAFVLQTVIVACTGQHNRRTMNAGSIPLSKGGWKPVLGGSGLQSYGMLSTSPLHAPPISKYKIPVPVTSEAFASSSRPLVARESKLTSIAQSYKPTTVRSLAVNGPIHSYVNPFALPTAGLSHYKLVQNFPLESIVIRNPQYSYLQRPIYAKYPNSANNKYKQNLHNTMVQQFNNNHLNVVQPIHFPYYHTTKNPHDLFTRTFDDYARPTENSLKHDQFGKASEHKKPDSYKMEIFKPEVFKLTDTDAASQSAVAQQVKTAQQSLAATLKPSTNSFQQYTIKDDKFPPIPPSILGSFNSFGIQSVKSRDPANPSTKTNYLSPAPTKQTMFNSYNYAQNLNPFLTTTPKIKLSPNQLLFGSLANTYPQTTKQTNPFKLDSGLQGKDRFKASPQDPFRKPVLFQQGLYENFQSQKQNPFLNSFPQTIQTPTASVTSYFNFNPSPTKQQSQTKSPFTATPSTSVIYGQNSFDFEKNKHVNQNSLPSGNYPQAPTQYSFDTPENIPTFSFELPKEKPVLQSNTPTPVVPHRGTYDVTENWSNEDIITNAPHNSWGLAPNIEPSTVSIEPNSIKHSDYQDLSVIPSNDDTQSDVQEDLTIVTSDIPDSKGHENYVSYETDYDTQTRRPHGDNYDTSKTPSKYKNKNYYKVTTPTYEESTTAHYKRPKPRPYKFGESKTKSSSNNTINGQHKSTQTKDNEKSVLPTLPPHKHFKRPQQQEGDDKDKVRKRNKIRRRRPQQNVQKEDINDIKTAHSTTEQYTTETEDPLLVKPRRPSSTKPKTTTPTVTTELSSSAVPTLAPTTPSVVMKKKQSARKTTTLSPTDSTESTTNTYKIKSTTNSESSIMKIGNRQQQPKVTTFSYGYQASDLQDHSHKQDEKDTPTSDVAIDISNERTRPPDTEIPRKTFSFHVDAKPIDAKPEALPSNHDTETDNNENNNTEKQSEISEVTEPITTQKSDTTSSTGKSQRHRLKNKYEHHRPRFSVKDYRNRMSSTTTTEKPVEPHVPKIRFPQRKSPFIEVKSNADSDNSTEAPRKKFTPKDPRHKTSENETDKDTTVDRSRIIGKQKATFSTEISITESVTPKLSARVRNGQRREPNKQKSSKDENNENQNQNPVHIRRPGLRKKVKPDDSLTEPSEDFVVTEINDVTEHKESTTSERYKSESAIMKIAKDDKKHSSNSESSDHISEHSKRVSDLTLAASKDYNNPGVFKTVSPNSRRIPSYFTIATDDPILPIEAFFPQLNQKKET